jgi:protein SCO1/2
VNARGVGLHLVLCLAAAACGHGASNSNFERTASSREVADAPSLYALRPSLRDEHGHAVGLDVLRGHPALVTMFYASCPAACPLLVSNVARIDAELPGDAREKLRVLLVSFDAVHDSPEVLRAVGAQHHLDPARWTVAAAGEDDARELAAALGVAYRALPGGGFTHNSVITALDAEGHIVARADGPAADLSPLVHALEHAAR